jgi:glycogen debranching enzyme
MHGNFNSISAHQADKVVILRDGDTIAVLSPTGDVTTTGLESLYGLFHNEMRHSGISRLTINGAAPEFVSYSLDETATVATFKLKHGDFDIERTVFIAQQALEQRLVITYEGLEEAAAQIEYHVGADFENTFHIRGDIRAKRRDGEASFESGKLGHGAIRMHYSGIQGSNPELTSPPLSTIVRFATSTPELSSNIETNGVNSGSMSYEWRAGQRETVAIYAQTLCNHAPRDVPPSESFDKAMKEALQVRRKRLDGFTKIVIPGPVGEFYDSAVRDLNFLITDTPQGFYPYAGTPLYNREFGRDGLITGLLAELISPEIMLGVLHRLSARQAKDHDALRDAEPGKIPHELSKDEMSLLGRLPYDGYCGSADSTPLFLMAAGAIAKHIGDLTTARSIFSPLLPSFERALEWIDEHSNPDENGFARYARKTDKGLASMVWKDSDKGIVHANGEIAAKPVAAVEVQGYVYAGLKSLAAIYQSLGMEERAEQLSKRADGLRGRIESNFWRGHMSTYALAIDGNGKHCDVYASNAGHMLWTGVASPEHGRQVVDTLMHPNMFSGWGVRTLGASEVAYDPNGYHIGTVWPHDNAIIAMGLARYGCKEEAATMLQGMYDGYRYTGEIPELHRGESRVEGRGPEPYKEDERTHVIACRPQAWAAAAPIGVLQAILGIEFDAANCKLIIDNPYIPGFFPDKIQLNGLKVNDAKVDVEFSGNGYDVAVKILSSEGNIRVEHRNGRTEEIPFVPMAIVAAAAKAEGPRHAL